MPPEQPAPPATAPVPSQVHSLTEVVTRLRRALRATVRTDYPWEQLPMAQVELLQVLANESPMRVRDIATSRRLASSTVSTLITQLMAAGLVQRAVDPDDRRVAAVSLTAAGTAQLESWIEANERHINLALESLPAAQQRAIQNALPALDRLADLLDQPPADA
ncbi:MarR family winged helix-turn-helix transcriptional regulator [Leekyejoonella antrihumi]|uniref:MarR family transcriptional regulator n=1 Tax=Leekyejoonella antrihumi TaxID=1660198 RepID=A0A563E0Z3_9MICO|nr:MarR family transcriptional regulator [Leekyejoonella antrihumi]TWP36039.1 MarR family transcriptional regulator [Leekyejoonella antrihumi]